VTLRFAALFAIAAMLLWPPHLSAQAFTAPQGLGSFTLAWQYVDNTGHRFTDGFLRSLGQSVTTSLLFEGEYAITDRLSVTASIPYVFARYTGGLPPFSNLEIDSCRCWHSTFQDVTLAARYRFGDERRAITPVLRTSFPSHDYRFAGEAVVGRKLRETQAGVYTGFRLLEKTSLQAGYTYAFVQRAIPEIGMNRSNFFADAGYTVNDRLFVHVSAIGQRTHGGLRVGSPTGNPFFPPGEVNTPERYAQRDRLQKSQYWHGEAGAAYSFGSMDVFVAYTKYIWGRDTHNGQAYTVGATWYFDRSKW
jgi:hypothetical protein